MELVSDAAVRDIVNCTISNSGAHKYAPDAADRVVAEYMAKKHALKSVGAIVDLLDNAIMECAKANG